MTQRTNRVGQVGEELAVRYLAAQGYEIVDRNWRANAPDVRGEVDIVARDRDVLVFCEVKSRRRSLAPATLEGVTVAKQRQIRRLASQYLVGTQPSQVRFDVIAVSWPVDGGVPDVCHVPGAF